MKYTLKEKLRFVKLYDRNGGFYMKYTLKEKLRFVKLHIEENVPIYEIERKYGFRADALKYFCRLYKVHGEKAFQKEEGTRQEYSREMKLKAIVSNPVQRAVNR